MLHPLSPQLDVPQGRIQKCYLYYRILLQNIAYIHWNVLKWLNEYCTYQTKVFLEYFQQNIQDKEVVVRMFICYRKYCMSHIVCIFLPTMQWWNIPKKEMYTFGHWPSICPSKSTPNKNDFFHNWSHFNYFLVLILFRLFLSTSLFYNIFWKRKLAQINSSVVVRARLIMFGWNQINHFTLIWFDKSLAL